MFSPRGTGATTAPFKNGTGMWSHGQMHPCAQARGGAGTFGALRTGHAGPLRQDTFGGRFPADPGALRFVHGLRGRGCGDAGPGAEADRLPRCGRCPRGAQGASPVVVRRRRGCRDDQAPGRAEALRPAHRGGPPEGQPQHPHRLRGPWCEGGVQDPRSREDRRDGDVGDCPQGVRCTSLHGSRQGLLQPPSQQREGPYRRPGPRR